GLTGTSQNRTYTPAANFNGTDTFTFKVTDRGDPDNCTGAPSATCSAALTSSTQTVTITVNPVNDAPITTVPTAQTTNEDTSKTLSGTSALSVADVDVLETVGGTLKVSLSVGHGTLTLAGTTDLTFSVGDGTADATMTFTGTPSAINTALNGLTYT